MTRRVAILMVLAVVVLAGCLGGPGAETTTTDTTDDGTDDVSSEQVPGVTNGVLTNGTALAAANEAAVVEDGGSVRISFPMDATQATFRFVVGAGYDTYLVDGTRPGTDGKTFEVGLWSNETTRVTRTAVGGDVTYRPSSSTDDRPSFFESVGDYLSVGNFTVANETTEDGHLVLTADEYVASDGAPRHLDDVDEFSGRLVVDGSGRIHNLSVSMADASESVTYQYDLQRTGVDRVPQPDWLADMPADATLQPELSVNVENGSYLVVRQGGGDAVPRNTSLRVTTNGTTESATFATALDAGDTRYAYVDDATGDLTITGDRPAASDVDSLTSPVSYTIETDGGVTLSSGGMGWGSETVSEGTAGSPEQTGGSSSETMTAVADG